MKECIICGAMISPYPIHGTKRGICAECGGSDEVDSRRPKISGKHMRIEKSEEQKKQEEIKKNIIKLREQGRKA